MQKRIESRAWRTAKKLTGRIRERLADPRDIEKMK